MFSMFETPSTAQDAPYGPVHLGRDRFRPLPETIPLRLQVVEAYGHEPGLLTASTSSASSRPNEKDPITGSQRMTVL